MTSVYVLAEVATILRWRAGPSFVRTVVGDLFESRRLHKLRPTLEDEAAGFVDALSFALMKSHRITRVFTFDADFDTAGFEVIS